MTTKRPLHFHLFAMGLVAGLAGGPVFGAEAARGTLREMTTDRPDTTESPFTVDPGHVQLEMDVASYTRDRFEGTRITEWELAPFNLRYGLTPNFEAGIFVRPHLQVTAQPRDEPKSTAKGMGDTTLRMKLNFWGNDGGPTAFGMMVDLKLPTATHGLGNDRVDGALTFPVAYEIGAGWEGAAMTAIELVQLDRGRRAIWVNTITFAREFVKDVGGFVELASAAGEGAHVATFNCGLTWALEPRVQLDCGLNIGITRTAPDLTIFAGVSRKF